MDTILQTGLSNALVASALALVAVLVGYFYRRPALVHGLWLLVLLKLVTPPLVPILIAWPAQPPPAPAAVALPTVEPSDTPLSPDFVLEPLPANEDVPPIVVQADPEPEQSEAPVAASPAAAAPPAPLSWQTLVAGVWLAGSTGWFLLAGWRVWRFRQLLRFAAPAPESLCKMAQRLARKMDLRACPAVYLVPGRVAPMLWAIGGQPRLLVPRELLAHLTREQQETLLAHELAHLRRRDHWVRGLEFLAMGLYWWHPVVWYARRALREAEEQCCDAWVVSQLPGASKTYATALLETLDFLSDARPATPLLASSVGQVSDLKRRLTMIMCGSTPRALSWRGTLVVLALGLFVLPLLPTFVRAQAPDKPVELQVEGLRFQLNKGPEDAKAQDELAKARADLAKLQQAMKATQQRIQALEAQLAAEKGAKGGVTEKERVIVLRLDDGKYGVTEIHLRKVGDKWEIVQPAKDEQPSRELRYRAEEKDGVIRAVPFDPAKGPAYRTPPAVPQGPYVPGPSGQPMLPPGAYGPTPKREQPMPMLPQGPNTQPPKTGTPAPESRIDNLERQLKKIMDEIESLRREMKQPGKTGTTPGYSSESKPRLEENRRGLTPGTTIEEKDGIRIITLPESTPVQKPGDPFEIAPKR